MSITRFETGQTSHRFPQFLPDGLTPSITIFAMKTLGCFLAWTCISATLLAYADSDLTLFGAVQHQGKLTLQFATQTATTFELDGFQPRRNKPTRGIVAPEWSG